MVETVDARIAEHGRQWREKPVVREIYLDLYGRMAAAQTPGTTLEIGGGSGIFKDFARDCITTDILPAPWLDVVNDAQALPFVDSSFDNIVMFDVLHHLEFPVKFFREAVRVLRPGGRVIMVEPAMTPVSLPFYKLLHPEPAIMDADPFVDGAPDPTRDAFDANQAIPTLMFGRDRARFEQMFPALRLRDVQRLSLFAYPLSGGFKPWSLLPVALVKPLLALEDKVAHVLGGLMGFRLLAVIEKRG
ncbi:MAG: class I SAM-dependent methyltransferase [Rhodospirillaceae bacterium]|nr:class I SAM-dependent methyltransferase [Rhodospirillaceae bacterium]